MSSRQKPNAGLREVVGAEREELGRLGDLRRGDRGARELDHRAPLEVVELDALGPKHLRRNGFELGPHLLELRAWSRPAGS
jgi:hypothetical protein